MSAAGGLLRASLVNWPGRQPASLSSLVRQHVILLSPGVSFLHFLHDVHVPHEEAA
jgi:hypothetical protein